MENRNTERQLEPINFFATPYWRYPLALVTYYQREFLGNYRTVCLDMQTGKTKYRPDGEVLEALQGYEKYGNRVLHAGVKRMLDTGWIPSNAKQLALEWPTIASDGRLSYSQSIDKIARGIRTVTTLGRYLTKHFNVPDHVIRDVEALMRMETPQVLHTTEDFVDAALHGPSTCMTWTTNEDGTYNSKDLMKRRVPHHPYQVYDPKYGWRMLVRKNNLSQITGRAIFLHPSRGPYVAGESLEGMYVRTFKKDGESTETDEVLNSYLQDIGLEKPIGWPDGAKLARFASEHYPNGILPYLDGEHYYVRKEDDWTFELSQTRGNIKARNQNGTSLTSTLEICQGPCGLDYRQEALAKVAGENIYERYKFFCASCVQGLGLIQAFSLRCNVMHVPPEHVITVQGRNYDLRYLQDNHIVTLHNGEYSTTDEASRCGLTHQYYLHDELVKTKDIGWVIRSRTWTCGRSQYTFSDRMEWAEVDGVKYQTKFVQNGAVKPIDYDSIYKRGDILYKRIPGDVQESYDGVSWYDTRMDEYLLEDSNYTKVKKYPGYASWQEAKSLQTGQPTRSGWYLVSPDALVDSTNPRDAYFRHFDGMKWSMLVQGEPSQEFAAQVKQTTFVGEVAWRDIAPWWEFDLHLFPGNYSHPAQIVKRSTRNDGYVDVLLNSSNQPEWGKGRGIYTDYLSGWDKVEQDTWLPGKVPKPAGFYMSRSKAGKAQGYRYWNGRRWGTVWAKAKTPSPIALKQLMLQGKYTGDTLEFQYFGRPKWDPNVVVQTVSMPDDQLAAQLAAYELAMTQGPTPVELVPEVVVPPVPAAVDVAVDPRAHIPWNSGQPPGIGWWNASRERKTNAFRHWNGSGWSIVVKEEMSLTRRENALYGTHSVSTFDMEWRNIRPSWDNSEWGSLNYDELLSELTQIQVPTTASNIAEAITIVAQDFGVTAEHFENASRNVEEATQEHERLLVQVQDFVSSIYEEPPTVMTITTGDGQEIVLTSNQIEGQ